MGSSLRTRETIVFGEAEGKTFYEIIEASYPFGWRNFDQSCLENYEAGLITEETALLYCSKRGAVQRGIDNIKKRRGENTTEYVLKMADKIESNHRPAAPPPMQTVKFR
jgi:twitching motility protein PilT